MNSSVLIKRDYSMSYLAEHHRMQELTVDQVVDKYLGFEGEFVLSYPLLDDQELMRAQTQDFLEVKDSDNELILNVIEEPDLMPSVIKKQSHFLGYEVGFCEYDATIYSSIFNEVLFGNVQELISYKEVLNEHLLLPDRALAAEYIKLHDELSARGAHVEDYFKMVIYEIWKPHESA